MWDEGSLNHEMMGWCDSSWHWFFGFHGIMSAIFLAVIVVVLALLVRDLRRDHEQQTTPTGRDGKPSIDTAEANLKTHSVRRS